VQQKRTWKGESMRKLLIICLVVSAMVVTGGVASAQKGTVVYYSSGGAKVAKVLVKTFNEMYPDITVETIIGGTGELTTRIKAEKQNPRGDVFRAAVEAFHSFPELFESYQTNQDALFSRNLVGKSHKFYAYSTAIQLFIVNTGLMTEVAAPKSWKALGNPKYKGKIIMAHPAVSGSAFRQIAQMVHLHGWGLVGKVVDNTNFVAKSRLVYTNVAKGEYAIGVTEESKPYRMAKDGYPTIAVYPAEGVAMSYGAVGLIKGGPNPKNARLFADFINSKEGHQIAVKVENRRSPRADVAAPKLMPKTSDIKFFEFDEERAAKNREEILRKFEELYSKKK
jgi:iron(III) transport system substrate-binding protein